MMNSANEWQTTLPEFLLEAEKLLRKSEECLSHLHLIRNDSDAIDCMKFSLTALACAGEPLDPADVYLRQAAGHRIEAGGKNQEIKLVLSLCGLYAVGGDLQDWRFLKVH